MAPDGRFVTPRPSLEEAAAAAHRALARRVAEHQGGVPTFFDNFLDGLLRRLVASAALHGWDPRGRAVPGSEHAQRVAELAWLEAFLERQEQGRFVPYSLRRAQDRVGAASEITGRALIMSQGTTACLTWQGEPLFKTAYDFALLPMLLSELRPATVLEIGSGTGASARWIADMMRAGGVEGYVHSVDIKPVAASYSRVQFRTGDCRSPETLFDLDVLRGAPHPWLVIEDAHVNVHDVLVRMDAFLTSGDYLIVEDSVGKRDELDRFMAPRDDRFRVDTRYTDFFGRNVTCAENAILARV
jgi:cephalosporin hydroxylase